MRHPAFGALKVGVSGRADEPGMDSIEADGWELVGTWWFAIGFDALAAEEAVLDRWWNVFSLGPALRPEQLLQADAVETVPDRLPTRRDTLRFLDEFSERASAAIDADEPDADQPDPWLVSIHTLDAA